jgi:hypothetical protein
MIPLAAAAPQQTHQAFLDELVSHWYGTRTPDTDLAPITPQGALSFFQQYQRALGEGPVVAGAAHVHYVRGYHPDHAEIVTFVHAYHQLRRGNGFAAATSLLGLTRTCPRFSEPWIWLAATTDDTDARIGYLERALAHEPGHPLARDAMAVARGRVEVHVQGAGSTEPSTDLAVCRHCGGSLSYEPGAAEVVCTYCGTNLKLERTDVLAGRANLVSDLRLKRRQRVATWTAADHLMWCKACGAELTHTSRMGRRCTFCGSTNVLVEDSLGKYQQPDGFIPFGIDEAQATAEIRRALRWGLGGLKALVRRGERPDHLHGVYVPFWAFDGFIEMREWRSEAQRYATPVRAGQDVPPMKQAVMLNDLLYAATKMPAPSLLRRLFPFHMRALVPYEPRLLADWPAALYARDVEALLGEVHREMVKRAKREIVLPIGTSSSDDETDFHRAFNITNTTYQLVLLPVWATSLRSEDKSRLALVNGQTGKVAIERRFLDRGPEQRQPSEGVLPDAISDGSPD